MTKTSDRSKSNNVSRVKNIGNGKYKGRGSLPVDPTEVKGVDVCNTPANNVCKEISGTHLSCLV